MGVRGSSGFGVSGFWVLGLGGSQTKRYDKDHP